MWLLFRSKPIQNNIIYIHSNTFIAKKLKEFYNNGAPSTIRDGYMIYDILFADTNERFKIIGNNGYHLIHNGRSVYLSYSEFRQIEILLSE